MLELEDAQVKRSRCHIPRSAAQVLDLDISPVGSRTYSCCDILYINYAGGARGIA